jgi:hypothetical protein
MIFLAALAMSVGWGFRGDYGHEAGAMVPGALLGLAISLTSRRPDWQSRGVTLAFLGAIGWAFGGQMSYGKVIGYTLHSSFPDVHYGYYSLFLIGGLWGGIGAGILAQGLTESSETLERWWPPLVILWCVWQVLDFTGITARLEANEWLHHADRAWWLKDADWVAALSALLSAGITAFFVKQSRLQAACIAFLASGWLISFFVLVGICHLHMSPPRGDNWAGCVGLFLALIAYLFWQRNRAALYLMAWGFFAGGVGFACAQVFQVIVKAYWGPLGEWAYQSHLNGWKLMELSFGFIMGGMVAIGVCRLAVGRLEPPTVLTSKNFDLLSLAYLLVIMMWENLHKNWTTWSKAELLPRTVFDANTKDMFIVAALLLSAVVLVAIYRQSQGKVQLTPPGILGRIRWLFLLILWINLAGDFAQVIPRLKEDETLPVQMIYWLFGSVCSLLVLLLPEGFAFVEDARPANDSYWKTRWVLLVGIVLSPALVYGLAKFSIGMHESPLPGSHLRFGEPEEIKEQ